MQYAHQYEASIRITMHIQHSMVLRFKGSRESTALGCQLLVRMFLWVCLIPGVSGQAHNGAVVADGRGRNEKVIQSRHHSAPGFNLQAVPLRTRIPTAAPTEIIPHWDRPQGTITEEVHKTASCYSP